MLNGQTMGTTYTVKLVPQTDAPSLEKVSAEIEKELASVNQQMSTYLPNSEISLFNESGSTDWFDVSSETAATVQQAQEFSVITDGAFDVTIGPLVDIWGFGPNGRSKNVPSKTRIDKVRATCGYDKLSVRLAPPALRKSVADLQVDLSAIAKGHGVDRVASIMDRLGFEAYFVEIGGEVRTRGKKADGTPWRIGIERPLVGKREMHLAVELASLSLATSGNYRNFYELGDGFAVHTIDPKTGMTAHHLLASASALASDCATADAIATTMMVLGEEAGFALANNQNWAVLLIVHDESTNSGFATITTKRFDELSSSERESKPNPEAN